MQADLGLTRRLAGAVLALAALAAPAFAGEVTAVRIGAEQDGVRVVIEADQPLDYRLFTLAEQGFRMVLDMPRVDWEIPGEPAAGGQRRADGEGMVTQYRFAQNTAVTSRLVLDLAVPARIANRFILAPDPGERTYRMVLDLAPATVQEFAGIAVAPSGQPFQPVQPVQVADAGGVLVADASTAKPPAARITSAPPPPAAEDKPLIVIDAGHGGKDPGALGATGKREKDVNLAAALALRDVLLATGRYEVALTRASDVFLELDQRLQIARARDADLFISLHSDSAANKSARGASVYTLSEQAEGRTRNKILSNNWTMDITEAGRGAEVTNILLDLSMRDTKNQSATFAEIMIASLGQVSPMLSNSHREAGYYVLLAPDVPAVLLEMGFMSNSADESNLTSSTYRQGLMTAVAGAIDNYFNSRQRRFAGN